MSSSVTGLLEPFASSSQLEALERYYELLVHWNEKVNLTAIVEHDEVYVKHFWDSLAVMQLPLLRDDGGKVKNMIDVGTGAGLPGIPLAICNPDIEVTLCDALRKRTDFLETVVKDLGLNNVTVYHARSEEFARLSKQRNQYDLVVARAVAKLGVLTELLVPFCRPGGHVVCYKGPDVSEEIEDARKALQLLGGKVEDVAKLDLPSGYGRRSLVVIGVERMTNKRFPRKAGTPQRQPL